MLNVMDDVRDVIFEMDRAGRKPKFLVVGGFFLRKLKHEWGLDGEMTKVYGLVVVKVEGNILEVGE